MLLFVLVAAVGPASAITRGSTSTVVNSTATGVVSVARPSATVAGDVLVACLALNGGSVAAAGVPLGWTPIAAVTAIANPHVFGYYRVAGALEPASYGWTLAGAVVNGAGIARYSGVDTTSPLDSAAISASGASATSATVAGVTTVTANAMRVGCMAINSSNTAVTIGSPTGMSQAWDIGGKRHELADGPQAGAGASGPKTWTFSATREWAGWLTALRPQAATPAAPETTITSGPSGTVAASSASFGFSSSVASATFECALDAAAFTACASPVAYTGLADGSHTFQVRASAAGVADPTPAGRSWMVAATPAAPDTTITSGPSGTVSQTSASFGFSSSVASATFECALDAAVFSACVSPVAYTGLADGSHSFQVRASAAGVADPTPAGRSWSVDATAPTVTAVSPADGAAAVAVGVNVQVSFSEAIDPATLTSATFTLTPAGGVAVGGLVGYDPATKTATLNPSSDLAAGAAYAASVTVGVRDVAGNPIAPARVWSFTTATAPPPPPPSGAVTRASTSTVVNSAATGVVSIPKPSGTTVGDVLVACLALNGGSVAAGGVPLGWTPIAAVTAIANPHVFGYYRVAGALEPASYGWTLAGAVVNGAGIARYSGVDTTSPLDSAATSASGASATSATVAGVTTVTANAMRVGCMAINSSNTAVTIGSPTGMSQAWDIGGKRHELADGPQAAAGASGPKTWTFSAAREWAAWLTALRPR